MFFVQRNGTFAFKNYSWEFQTALLLLNVYYLRWIIRPANTNQVRCFKLLDNRWPGCQRLFTPGFRFRSILYSEWCAHICLTPSQNSNFWRPNINVWTHFEPIFRYVSTVGSKRRYHNSRVCVDVARRDSCRFGTMFLYWCSEDRRPQLAISFESEPLSPANFHKLARTVLLFGSYSGQIFPRRNLLTRRRK